MLLIYNMQCFSYTISLILILIILLIVVITYIYRKYYWNYDNLEKFHVEYNQNEEVIKYILTWKLNHIINSLNKYYNVMTNKKTIVNTNLSNVSIHIINMPSSIKRFDNIVKQVEFYNINNLTIHEAVNGRTISNKNEDTIKMKNGNIKFINYSKTAKKEEIGCTLSHLSIIKNFYDKYANINMSQCDMKNTYIMICEDDVSFIMVPFWKKSIKEVVVNAPDNWEIIGLYSACYNVIDTSQYILYNKNQCYGLVSYLINLIGCRNIIETLYDHKTSTYILKPLPNKDRSYIVSDCLLVDICKSYAYTNTMMVPINDFGSLDSTIHTEYTYNYILDTIKILKPFYKKFVKPNVPNIYHSNDNKYKKLYIHGGNYGINNKNYNYNVVIIINNNKIKHISSIEGHPFIKLLMENNIRNYNETDIILRLYENYREYLGEDVLIRNNEHFL